STRECGPTSILVDNVADTESEQSVFKLLGGNTKMMIKRLMRTSTVKLATIGK
ncbi:unnamed protein product, partial [Urochloa humidicola]